LKCTRDVYPKSQWIDYTLLLYVDRSTELPKIFACARICSSHHAKLLDQNTSVGEHQQSFWSTKLTLAKSSSWKVSAHKHKNYLPVVSAIARFLTWCETMRGVRLHVSAPARSALISLKSCSAWVQQKRALTALFSHWFCDSILILCDYKPFVLLCIKKSDFSKWKKICFSEKTFVLFCCNVVFKAVFYEKNNFQSKAFSWEPFSKPAAITEVVFEGNFFISKVIFKASRNQLYWHPTLASHSRHPP